MPEIKTDNDVTALLLGLGRLEGKLDVLITTMNRHEETLAAHEAQNSAAAQAQAKMLGIAIGASSVVSILVTIAGTLLKK